MEDVLFKTNFEPNFEYDNKYKKYIIIYIIFIATILLSLIILGVINLVKGPWKSDFELKEIKVIRTAAIGEEDETQKNKFNLDFINDIYFTFSSKNKKNNIKTILFEDINIKSENKIDLYKRDNKDNIFSNNKLNLEDKKEKTLEFSVPKKQTELTSAFRIKIPEVSSMQVDHSIEIKPNLLLLKNENKEKFFKKTDYELTFNIIVELEDGRKYISKYKYQPEIEINFENELDIKYLDTSIIFEKKKEDKK